MLFNSCSETAQAMATPSSLLVALPSSSIKISDFGVELRQMKAVSFISNLRLERESAGMWVRDDKPKALVYMEPVCVVLT